MPTLKDYPDLGHEGDPDLFGRFWTWDELQTVERPRGPKTQPDWAKTGERPDWWPSDTQVDTKSSWAFWLPDGWGQGIKETSGGKTLKCYVGPPPEGKRFFHKPDIIKYCTKKGLPLPQEQPQEKEEKEEKTVRNQIPHWPDTASYHLPKDWRIGYRQLPSTLHRIYIPPGQSEGFLFQGNEIAEYLAGKKKLSKIEGSKKMVEIMADAGNKDPTLKSKKRKRGLADEDYAASTISLVDLPPDRGVEDWSNKMSELGILTAKDLAQEALKVQEGLKSRKFPASTRLIAVAKPGDGPTSQSTPVDGIYYQMADLKNHKPLYQKAYWSASQGIVGCEGVYIFYEDVKWRIGSFAHNGCVGFNVDEASDPTQLKKPWHVLKDLEVTLR